MSINAGQIQLIHIGAAELGWDKDHYRDVLSERYNAESCKDLSFHEAEDLLGLMKSCGFTPKPPQQKRPKDGKIIRLASASQQSLINVLQANIKWHAGPDGFKLWLKKRMRIPKVSTAAQASAVIEGLKGMLGINSRVIELRELPFPIDLTNIRRAADGEPCVWVYDSKSLKLARLPKELVHG